MKCGRTINDVVALLNLDWNAFHLERIIYSVSQQFGHFVAMELSYVDTDCLVVVYLPFAACVDPDVLCSVP